jgi:O-antigen/teichoic acid export membrane protein
VTSYRYDSFSEEPSRRAPGNFPSPSPPQSRLASLQGVLKRNEDLLRNAGSLAATTGVTSVLGFGYWIYAARFFPQEAVGYATAEISTMTLLGTIGMFGLGTMLIGELPRGGNRGGLMTASFIASFIGSFILGFGFSLVTLSSGSHFVELNGTIGRIAIFSFSVAITGATLVFDDATIGLMRGGLQLSRNVTVSVAKMAILPTAALVLHDLFGLGIMLAWVIGTVASLIPPGIAIKRSGSRILHRPDWDTFWQLGKVTLSHNWLNLAITTPTKLIPVLVAIVVSPKENAAYYIATMMSSFLYMVPQHLSTVLFAIASAAPEMIPEKLRFVLRMSLIVGVPAGLVMGVSSHFLLSIFGSDYASLATGPLWILIIGYIPGLPSTVYIAVCRATGRVNQAAIFLSVFAAIQMGFLVVGGKLWGLYGASYGMLAVGIIEGFITTPPVLRAAFGKIAIPAGPVSISAAQERLQPVESFEEARLRQESGIAALIALATATASQPRPLQSHRLRPETGVGGWQADGQRRTTGSHRRPTVRVTVANPALKETTWWQSPENAGFRAQQESGVAALIAIATHAARF